jgi:FAD:protein FMN transferase
MPTPSLLCARTALISLSLAVTPACQRGEDPRPPEPSEPASAPARESPAGGVAPNGIAPTAAPESVASAPLKVDVTEKAMGTQVRVIAFTNARADDKVVREAIQKAVERIRQLEDVMTTWRASELQNVNEHAGDWVTVGPDSLDVLKKSVWAGKMSKGTFDITFASMNGLWKFGDAAEEKPKLPSKAALEKAKKLIDYRKIEIDESQKRVKIGTGQHIDVGGIAKGYAVDAAARVLRAAGVTDFLVQAGGDLLGSGRKPDGSPWVSGIRDPRGPEDSFFATIELTDHAFSTAGDYARAFIVDGKRYHHIIDPRTGYPATACRSVTIWAGDAFTADAVDDAVFILGPKEGLEIVESLPDVGAVVVDAHNKVWVSKRLTDKVKVLRQPTEGI